MRKVQDDDLVMGLVDRALSEPLEKREAFVRGACGGDTELCDQVWDYVQSEQRMDGFLQRPLWESLPWRPPYPASAEHPFQSGELPDDPFGPVRGLAAEREHPLEAGQILQNRFHIVREVGHGGMGVVYEAVDAKVDHRRVAIKCARAGFRERLSPEVRHASEISHPNVCKTYDVHTADTGRGEIDFITMEFIDGQTLGDRLGEGPVPKGEAEKIAKQLCAGLAEAHRRQVIHGDLKSTNVLLAQGPDGVRAVITDFGLARDWQPQAAFQSGEAGGALDYMAPELFQLARPSAASDIYALGVILHELATGRKPFDTGTHWEERARRRPAPLQHRWRRIVQWCLEPDPARRCHSVAEVAQALGPSRWIRWWGMAAAAVAVAGLAGAIAYRSAASERETIRLAVLPFEADAGSKLLSDGLLQDTADRLKRVKPPAGAMPGWFDTHSRAKLTIIPIGDAEKNHVDEPKKAAQMLGATHVLTGGLHWEKGRVSIRARLSDARSGLPLNEEWQEEYAANELGKLPVALAGMVTGTLHLTPQAAPVTVNRAAYADFTEGVALLRRDTGVDAAIPLLQRAVAADPDSPLTHARLAEAEAMKYSLTKNTSWLEQAKNSLQEARRRNPDLAVVRLVSGTIDESEGFHDRAESDLRRGLEIEPLNGDVWRRLGGVYVADKRFAEALWALRKAIEAQPDYFKNYQALCSLYVQQANYKEAVLQCRKVVQLAPDLSDAHRVLGIAYFHSEQYAECESELNRALELDRKSSTALGSLAVVLFYQSRFADAIPLFRRAIEAGPATIVLYLDLGTSLQMIGRTSEAREAYRKGVAQAEKELETDPGDASARSALALMCARLGQRGRAESEARQAGRLAGSNVEVAKLLVRTYEVLGERGRAFEIVQSMPGDALRNLNNSPDLADLRGDSRFKQLMASHHIQ